MGVSHDPVAAQNLATKRSFEVADFPVPSGREEAWRFTPKARFKPLFDDAPGDTPLALTVSAPAGVTVSDADPASIVDRAASAPADRVAVLAAKHAPTTTVVAVPADADVAEPVVLRLHGTDADKVAWGSLLIEVGANARATVVVEHTGSATYGSHVSVVAGDGAHVDFVSVQNWADDAVHGGHLAVRAGRDSVVRGIVATLNGGAVRLAQTVDYTGPGGDVDLIGAYLAESGQHIEHRILVDHAVPHCRSNVTYKGALAGAGARAVWIGDVVIRADALGTDTYELNRNLLLTDGARADSVPNLEIETGEIVGAGHASATGRFDDDQLFYLQARGVPPAVARRLVVRGFFADVVRRIAAPGVRAEVLQAIDAELATLSAGEDGAVMEQYAEIFLPEASQGETSPEAG